ncbi:RNA-directed DNA polymerase, eukaryota, Reverse transcriptase zinc-binding domain protein [Artemisia annua]|uniref:RNA-directed DNA polymerase, eukaryota, Reverse transcriptase zinc-binding domain protein n=1 Tax=Artemisia annua TaxID=35608 RepID=A0A2U1NA55_ARTAN|nr:RNA-directed DNA polymerase, eukaryota, Reverse transcriptase zinc-binding domain protein [Artemisia annua]
MNYPDPPNPNPMLVPPPKESNDVSRQSRSTRSVSGAGKSSLKQVNAVSKSGLGSMKKSSRKGSKKKRLLKGMDRVEYEVEDTEEMDTRDENFEVNDGNSTVGVNTNEEDGVGSGLDEVSATVNQIKSVVNETNNTNAYVNDNSVENMGSRDISSNVNNTVGEMPVPFENNPILNPGNGKAMNHGSVSASDKMSIGNVVGEVADVNANTEMVWPSLKETMQKDTVMLDQNSKQPMSFVNAFQGIGGYGNNKLSKNPGRINEQGRMVFGHEFKKCSNRVITMEERNEKDKDVNQSMAKMGESSKVNEEWQQPKRFTRNEASTSKNNSNQDMSYNMNRGGFNNRGRGRNGMMGRGNMSQRNGYENNGVRFVQVESGANKVDETQIADNEKTKWSEDVKKYYKDKCDAKAKGKMMEGLKWRISMLQKDIHHLFFSCEFSRRLWERLKPLAKLEMVGYEWASVISSIVNKSANNTIWSVIQRLSFGAIVYFIWQERNIRRMQQISRSEEVVFNCIVNTIRFKLLGLTLKYSKDVIKAAEILNIPLGRKEYYRRMVDELSRPCDDTPMFIMGIIKMELPPSVFKLSSVMNTD